MFTNECYIKLVNQDLIDYLITIGYSDKSLPICIIDFDGILVSNGIIYLLCEEDYNQINGYNCEHNILLFMSIAALRNDSDRMQWFVTDVNQYCITSKIEINIPRGSFELCFVKDRYMGQNKEFCNSIVPAHKANITELETYMSNANFQFKIQGKISVSWKEMKKRMELNYGK